MTPLPPQLPDDELLGRATAALAARAHDATPPAALVARVLQSDETLRSRRTLVRKLSLPAAGLAAAILLLVGWIVFQNNSRLALADVLQNVEQVQTARMKMHVAVQMAGRTVEMDGIMILDNTRHRMRQEMNDGQVINIFDMPAGKGLIIMPQARSATRLDLAHMPKEQAPQDMLASLKKMQAGPSKDLGEQAVAAAGGRKLHGFYAERKEGDSIHHTTLWADPDTRMPVILDITIEKGFLPTHMILSDFEWNATIDESLLKLEIPEGYTVRDTPMEFGAPAESDLVAALKASTAFNAGKFPAGFTIQQLAMSLQGTLADKSQLERKMQELGGNMLIVSRGWAFMADPKNGSHWYWAGADVAPSEKNRPILWYQPAGKTTWRIIDADYSVRDAAEAPDVNAVPIDASQSKPPPTP